jgi:nucleoside phosphorylase
MPLLNIDHLNSDIDAHEGAVALIVTALPLEKDAVLGHFSEHKSCFGSEGSIYQWGQFAGEQVDWLVVVITTGPGNIGSGQQVAQAVMELGQVDLILFAGVAGSRKGDVPIGSVVAASKVYFAHHGKAEAGHGPVTLSFRP